MWLKIGFILYQTQFSTFHVNCMKRFYMTKAIASKERQTCQWFNGIFFLFVLFSKRFNTLILRAFNFLLKLNHPFGNSSMIFIFFSTSASIWNEIERTDSFRHQNLFLRIKSALVTNWYDDFFAINNFELMKWLWIVYTFTI